MLACKTEGTPKSRLNKWPMQTSKKGCSSSMSNPPAPTNWVRLSRFTPLFTWHSFEIYVSTYSDGEEGRILLLFNVILRTDLPSYLKLLLLLLLLPIKVQLQEVAMLFTILSIPTLLNSLITVVSGQPCAPQLIERAVFHRPKSTSVHANPSTDTEAEAERFIMSIGAGSQPGYFQVITPMPQSLSHPFWNLPMPPHQQVNQLFLFIIWTILMCKLKEISVLELGRNTAN